MSFLNVYWMKTNVELFRIMQRYYLRMGCRLNEGIALRFTVAWET